MTRCHGDMHQKVEIRKSDPITSDSAVAIDFIAGKTRSSSEVGLMIIVPVTIQTKW